MDFFKFVSATDPTTLDQGQHINYLKSALWVERYSQPGEFSFSAPLSTGLREFLPIGTLISHVDTYEIMIVENHEIVEEEKVDPTLVITGRSFVSYLENRAVGVSFARGGSSIIQYKMMPNNTWTQIRILINDHIAYPVDPNDVLVNVLADTALTGTGTSVERIIDWGSVWERTAELLKIDDLGIRTIRKNPFGVGSTTQTIIDIYKGVDKSASVLFSYKAGDLSSTEYLFSNKNDKNSALVVGQYIFKVVDLGPTKYDRRMVTVDATDIDGNLGATPTGTVLTDVLNQMTARGQQALMNMNSLTISRADIAKTSKYQYRREYNIGDLIALEGDFGQIAVMRVVEYAEIEDENGESGHPTLALPGG